MERELLNINNSSMTEDIELDDSSSGSIMQVNMSSHDASGTLVRATSDETSKGAMHETNTFDRKSDIAHDYNAEVDESHAIASRFKDFSFPNEQDAIVSTDMWYGDGLNRRYDKVPSLRSSCNNHCPHSTPASSTPTPTRISFGSRTSSISSVPTSMLNYPGLSKSEERIKRQEFENETLFNQLRSFDLNQSYRVNDNIWVTECPKLRNISIRNSRRGSSESSAKYSRATKNRRSSLESPSTFTGPRIDQLPSPPRSERHRRASAVVDFGLHEKKGASRIIDSSVSTSLENSTSVSNSSYAQKSIEPFRALKKKHRRHSLVASPILTIENTKEQIRRNSHGSFNNFTQFLELNQLDGKDSIFAALSETGDNIQEPIVDLDVVNSIKLGNTSMEKRYGTILNHRVSSTIDEEGSIENLDKHNPDEVVSLIEFLNTS